MEDEELIECPLCYEIYNATNRQPKGFPCLHNMCLACVIELQKRTRGHRIQCPICKRKHVVPDNVADLPNNPVIMSLLDRHDGTRKLMERQQMEMRQKLRSMISMLQDSLTPTRLTTRLGASSINLPAAIIDEAILCKHNCEEVLKEKCIDDISLSRLEIQFDAVVSQKVQNEEPKQTTQVRNYRPTPTSNTGSFGNVTDSINDDQITPVLRKGARRREAVESGTRPQFTSRQDRTGTQKQTYYSRDYSRLAPITMCTMGSMGKTPKQLRGPCNVAATPTGTVLVADTWNHRISEWSLSGQVINQWGVKGTRKGQFKYPVGLAVARSGTVYVSSNHKVQQFDARGRFIKAFGSKGKGDGQLVWPLGVALDEMSQTVYIADYYNRRVVRFSMDGEYQGSFGASDLQRPVGMALHQDHIYVTDEVQHQIVVFDTLGNKVCTIGRKGKGRNGLGSPAGITIDYWGTIIVCDLDNNRLKFLSATGAVLHVLGSWGNMPGEFMQPTAATLTPGGELVVAESVGCRLQVFK